MEEKKDEEGSTMNEGEVSVAIAHAKRLVESGVNPANIGIITPYAAQVCFLIQVSCHVIATHLFLGFSSCLTVFPLQVVLMKMQRSNEVKLKEMEISTVDGFQGREKEVIIISMVRSNLKKEVF